MKKIISICLFIMLIALPIGLSANGFQSLPVRTEANIGSMRIEPRYLDGERIGGITVRGAIPEVTDFDELAYEIEAIFNKRINGGLGSAYFSYNIVTSGRFVSLIILSEFTAHGGSRVSRVDTINFDRLTMERVYAQDLMGTDNGFAIATNIVNNFIAQNFRHMPRIDMLDEDSSFYVSNGSVHFVFNRYEIAPGSEGVQSVAVYLNHLMSYLLEIDDYHVDMLNHGVRMLPLRRVADAFGYEITWNGYEHEIGIVRTNGNGEREVITLRLNQNAYMRAQDTISRTLEAAPQMINGVTHVPISFFEMILGMHYNISTDGTVELTIYNPYW